VADLAVLERWIESKPRHLSTFERFLGVSLGIDRRLGSITRELEGVKGVRSLSAMFAVSHHEMERESERPFTSLSLFFVAPPEEVIACCDRLLGPGRLARDARNRNFDWLVYRDGFLVATDMSLVRWEQMRPEWAHPVVPVTVRQDFLLTLVDRLVCESTVAPIIAALEPLAKENGVRFSRAARAGIVPGEPSREGFSIHFEPAIESELVIAAFRWSEPVAMRHLMGGMLTMGPRESIPPTHGHARLGNWEIDATLREVPHTARFEIALPNLGSDAFPLYDVSAGETTTWMITFLPADATNELSSSAP
jgi:hypothetical protein